MRNILSKNRGLVVDESRKKRVSAHGLPTQPARSIFCPVYKLPTFTLLCAHVLQVTIHYQNRLFTSVNSRLLPTINTPNKSDNILNKTILLVGGRV